MTVVVTVTYLHGMVISHGGDKIVMVMAVINQDFTMQIVTPFYMTTTSTDPYPSATFSPPHVVHHQENMVSANANNVVSQQNSNNQPCLYLYH